MRRAQGNEQISQFGNLQMRRRLFDDVFHIDYSVRQQAAVNFLEILSPVPPLRKERGKPKMGVRGDFFRVLEKV